TLPCESGPGSWMVGTRGRRRGGWAPLSPTNRRNESSSPLLLLNTLPSVPLPLCRSSGKMYFSPTRSVLLKPSVMAAKFVRLRKLVQSAPSGGRGFSELRFRLGGLDCQPEPSKMAPLEPLVPPQTA